MRRIPLVVIVLALLMLGASAHAGPPDAPGGLMVLDKVADGLRQYRKETDPKNASSG